MPRQPDTAVGDDLPPSTIHHVRWSGAIVVQLIDAPQAPVSICADVDSVDPDSCLDSQSGYQLQIDSGLASIEWGAFQADSGSRQAKVDVVADWNPADPSAAPFTNGTLSTHQPTTPVTYQCPDALKTGSMSAQEASLKLDVKSLTGSQPLDVSVTGSTIAWQLLSVDRAAFEAICSAVSTDTDVEITVALTPESPADAPSAKCPGGDPLAVAGAFLTAAQEGNVDRYQSCIYAGSEQDTTSLLSGSDWVTTLQSGDYQLDDEFERLPNMFSFGSPDLPPCTCMFNSNIDPNGRADITVTLEPDGLFYVTKLGLEFHA